MDNMGEAADLQRDLWPHDKPIGAHFSVLESAPRMLALLKKYDVPATYFIESWNLGIHKDFILSLADSGIEIGWHAWQHEPWAQLTDEAAERANFQRSAEAMARFVKDHKEEHPSISAYRGFRPPSGIIHGARTLAFCHEFGLSYISPAAERGAVVPVPSSEKPLAVLPFNWRAVDAFYYMETFGALRMAKGEVTADALSPDALVESYVAQVDQAIEVGGYVSLLFHPFLTVTQERLDAMERVLQHIARRRDEGALWMARDAEIAEWVVRWDGVLGDDPGLDATQWR